VKARVIQLNKRRLLSGCGRLLRNGLPMAKVEGYEIYINQDGSGKSLTVGWMRVPETVIKRLNDSIGDFALELEGNSETVAVSFDEAVESVVYFEVKGQVLSTMLT
jgi:hypothetical protein